MGESQNSSLRSKLEKEKNQRRYLYSKNELQRSAKHKTGHSNEQRLSCALVFSVSGVANLYTDLPALLLGGANVEKRTSVVF